jgi:hypothetical protein
MARVLSFLTEVNVSEMSSAEIYDDFATRLKGFNWVSDKTKS